MLKMNILIPKGTLTKFASIGSICGETKRPKKGKERNILCHAGYSPRPRTSSNRNIDLPELVDNFRFCENQLRSFGDLGAENRHSPFYCATQICIASVLSVERWLAGWQVGHQSVCHTLVLCLNG